MEAGAKALANSEQVTKELQDLLDEQRQRRLQIGAAGQLLIEGGVAEIMPLDDDDATHKAANPVKKDGTVILDEPAIEARENAMVERLLAVAEPVAVIVLGAAHDLADQFQGTEVEYSRVVPSRVESLLDP